MLSTIALLVMIASAMPPCLFRCHMSCENEEDLGLCEHWMSCHRSFPCQRHNYDCSTQGYNQAECQRCQHECYCEVEDVSVFDT